MKKLLRFDSNIESFKHRRAFTAYPALDMGSRVFFERIVNVKKIKELVFVSKARAKSR